MSEMWPGPGRTGTAVPNRSIRSGGGSPLRGFADVWADGSASLHLAGLSPRAAAAAVDEVLAVVPTLTVEVSEGESDVVAVLAARGFRPRPEPRPGPRARPEPGPGPGLGPGAGSKPGPEPGPEPGADPKPGPEPELGADPKPGLGADPKPGLGPGPWFARLWRQLDDLPEAGTPPGFTIRAVAGDEIAARVEVHRRAWDPKRIKRMLGLAVTGDESGSGYDLTRHRAVMASPVYQPELDLVAVGADGELVAYAIGWFDPVSRSVLFEPVGTVPEHGGLGLGRALGAEVLRVAAGLGAVQAVVTARGDDAYPVPHRLYTGWA